MWSDETLDYVGPIYRPPSEARSIILQATIGCTHNRCTFCPSFKSKKRFRIKPREVVEADLAKAARLYPDTRRLFVADGDALVLPMDKWRWLLPAIRRYLPRVDRVGVYATGRGIRQKSDADLVWLGENGLGIVYLGVESGDDETLKHVCKESTAAQLVASGRRVRGAGMKLSVTVLLGIAPPGRSPDHARQTGRLLTAMDPDYVGVLSVMVCEGTELAEQIARGAHRVPDPTGMLRELRDMLAHTELTRGLFMANHASNYLPLKVRMPRGKAVALEALDAALAGDVALKPEGMRAL